MCKQTLRHIFWISFQAKSPLRSTSESKSTSSESDGPAPATAWPTPLEPSPGVLASCMILFISSMLCVGLSRSTSAKLFFSTSISSFAKFFRNQGCCFISGRLSLCSENTNTNISTELENPWTVKNVFRNQTN